MPVKAKLLLLRYHRIFEDTLWYYEGQDQTTNCQVARRTKIMTSFETKDEWSCGGTKKLTRYVTD